MLVPLDHKSEEELTAFVAMAARTYRDFPSLDNLEILIEASRALRDH